jgi:hypothetical protein
MMLSLTRSARGDTGGCTCLVNMQYTVRVTFVNGASCIAQAGQHHDIWVTETPEEIEALLLQQLATNHKDA